MFPRQFKATADQRMALWGALLGVLVLLYAATEIIGSSHVSRFSSRIVAHAATLERLAAAEPVLARLIGATRSGATVADQADLSELTQSIASIPDQEPALREAIGRVLESLSAAGSSRSADAATAALIEAESRRQHLRRAVTEALVGVSGRLSYQLDNARQNKLLLSPGAGAPA